MDIPAAFCDGSLLHRLKVGLLEGAVVKISRPNVQRGSRHALQYALAALAAVVALFLRKMLYPLLGSANPYDTLWLAVVFSAWYCGIWPSVLSVSIGIAGIWYWFLPPFHSFAGKGPTEVFGMLGFLAFSAVIVALGESTRRIMGERQRVEQELREVHERLEERARKRTLELEEKTEALQRKTEEALEKALLLDLANDAIFIRSASDRISYWNRGAERLYGWSKEEVLGGSTHDLLHTEFPEPLESIKSREVWEGELRHSKKDGSQIIVESRWTTLRDKEGKPTGWLEINADVTARKAAEDATRRLSARILSLQDEERRRIARELHDSLGQYLAALKMNIDLLPTRDVKRMAAQCSEIVDRCLVETRTISHLLHPPLLDEAGFGSAARWYVEGFAERSGIEVKLDLPAELGRLNRDVETALFRALQEALTNVHRHSGSSVVDVRLVIDEKQVRLKIRDNGRGIPQKTLRQLAEGSGARGVGLAGMRERMRELGGSLQIQSDQTGTLLKIAVPIYEGSPQRSADGERNSAEVPAA